MTKKLNKEEYFKVLSRIGGQGKKMAQKVLAIAYCQQKFFDKIPTIKEIQEDMENSGLGKPSVSRIKEFLKKDKRTVKISDNQWRVKISEVSEEELGITENIIEKDPSATNKYLPSYKLHPKIEKVSLIPFQSNLYKEAVQNAFVEVIDTVKNKTGNPKDPQGRDLDGDKLVQYIFGCDNQIPIIKFNSLNNSLDLAEQRGLMNLFKGIVGIRDRKAHVNFIQKDPKKAFEYLVLASLLINLVDENTS